MPHTALIPRKKDQLGAALTEFVQENFLDSEVAHEKVDGLKVAEAAGGWLRREENAARTAREIATAARGAMAAADDDAVQELLRQLMERHMVAPDWSPTLAGVLEDVVAGRHHERVVDLVVAHTGDWVAAHPELFVETVRRRSPEWSPDLVDRLLAERLHAETLRYLAGIRRDRQHEARRAVDDWLDRLADEMRNEPATRARWNGSSGTCSRTNGCARGPGGPGSPCGTRSWMRSRTRPPTCIARSWPPCATSAPACRRTPSCATAWTATPAAPRRMR